MLFRSDGAECGGRVVGGGVWIAASGKIEFEASRQFCAVLCLVIISFYAGGCGGDPFHRDARRNPLLGHATIYLSPIANAVL